MLFVLIETLRLHLLSAAFGSSFKEGVKGLKCLQRFRRLGTFRGREGGDFRGEGMKSTWPASLCAHRVT